MGYSYVGRHGEGGPRYSLPNGQYIAGYPIGILHLEVWYPLLPGNVVNATTYSFPVRYQCIRGATIPRILAGDTSLLEALVAAGKQLELEGVRAIAGACGYLGNYQRELAAALDVPVYLSSLIQAPFIYRGLKPSQRIGVLCADSRSFTPRLLQACGVPQDIPMSVIGLQDEHEFAKILEGNGEFDAQRLQQELVGAAQRMVAEHPDTGAILLECSDMPPFAWAIQQAVCLPVFDFITLINWVHNSVMQHPYEGIC